MTEQNLRNERNRLQQSESLFGHRFGHQDHFDPRIHGHAKQVFRDDQ